MRALLLLYLSLHRDTIPGAPEGGYDTFTLGKLTARFCGVRIPVFLAKLIIPKR